jgi:hypothetical protein
LSSPGQTHKNIKSIDWGRQAILNLVAVLIDIRGFYSVWIGIAYLKTAYVSDKQRHLARLKVFAKVLNQDFNDFQFTRLNNVVAHGLDSPGRIPPYS